MTTQSGPLTCDLCGRTGARVRRVSRTNGRGDDLLVIEGVPVVTCSCCGENYLTETTLHEIARIKLHRKSLATERPVELASFSVAQQMSRRVCERERKQQEVKIYHDRLDATLGVPQLLDGNRRQQRNCDARCELF